MERRSFLTALLAALPLAALGRWVYAALPQNMKEVQALQTSWRSLLAPNRKVPAATDKLTLPAAQWKQRLTPMQFDILREEGTERAYSSPLDREKRAGVFACAGCGLPLFTSAMKYDSRTGWPSFITVIPGAVGIRTDTKFFVRRTEYHCTRCGGHQGHLFDDGPPPTGLRYCNNGVALSFIPKA